MDTYEENLEENEVISQPDPAENQTVECPEEPAETEQIPAVEESDAAQEDAPQIPTEGYYHGVGTGARENPYFIDGYTAAPQATAAPEKPKRPRKKGVFKKILKCTAASILIVALVASACGISIVATNAHWKHYNQILQQNFEEQIRVLRQQLEESQKNNAGSTTIPVEGLTPSQNYRKNVNSVVAINCVIRASQGNGTVDSYSAGSGFVLTSDGYIVTNYHVVEGATSVSVTFADGSSHEASYIGGDSINDIAVVKIQATGLQPVTVGSSGDLQVGEQVVAIGNALGELSFSLTVGYVSGIDRSITTDGSINNMIQTDASINSGNSGGPLFNARGEVVGITTAKYSGTTSSGASIEGVGFALPMDDVIGMLQDLCQYGYITGVYLGVMVRDVDPVAAATYGFPVGAYVQEVTGGTCAFKAGILPKDIITNVGGYSITCLSDLTRVLRNFKAGEQSTVVVWRGGQWLVLNIVFDAKPHN